MLEVSRHPGHRSALLILTTRGLPGRQASSKFEDPVLPSFARNTLLTKSHSSCTGIPTEQRLKDACLELKSVPCPGGRVHIADDGADIGGEVGAGCCAPGSGGKYGL